ncbi:MAG: Asp-tRNA(Asn)/Glu-tRNA(Gln) amidotransferase subunit GatC [Candidatus Eremiobacteraeota bacterium]|nr:Asp-tRNA(Asn)/Glu-tRNA(Gln) amidotransferase subunit GatC [Candidatus Eremiobacteraeota bacterium]MBV8433043.1 Asp-tRNA(Asn)/Glu-tRNA(Gln) amidotransferase subunit GatC [Candidatus Eremiobacteraeota bacterium]MBV8655072.1 Asp-tRNA(Asn)/Glu-tRNA(Gln) amidotransferase subunit GatC [Candidatus Eremiobacteraeota bacterium]
MPSKAHLRRQPGLPTTDLPTTDRSIPILSSEKIDVRYVAKLARIALTDEEVERFGAQLGDLLEHVNALGALDTSAVPATAQVVESRNVERPDTVVPCLSRETVMAQAPQRQGAFFRVPRIIAEG